MLKVAICLASAANCGKTTSLKKLGRLLTGEECTEDEIKKIFNYRGVKVGISSSGDAPECLKPGFDEIIAAECEILVCACRTKGAAADYAFTTARNMGYKIIWMGAARDCSNSLQEICNSQVANAIKGMIDDIIDNR